MKRTYLLILALFSFCSFGAHFLGGEITWKCVAPNQYTFQLDLYNECFWAGSNNLSIEGPNGPIALTRQSVVDMTAPCVGTSTITCTFTTGLGSGKRHRYITPFPITLNGTIPPTGWTFSYTDPAIGGSVVNTKNIYRTFYIKSVMYPYQAGCSSSPQFDSNPILAITSENQSISAFAQPGQSGDSLYYHFYQPMITATSPDTFATGFSAIAPFPSNLSHTQNGPVAIHHNSGLIDLDIQAATTGLYTYGVEVEQWRNKQLTAMVWRNVQGFLKLSPSTNKAPAVAVDTSLFKSVQRNGNVYRIHTYPGDTVYFEAKAIDSNLNSSNSQYQVIDFEAHGFPLDATQWGGSSNFVNKISLSPVSPQVGFSNQLSNTIACRWPIAKEHLNGNGMPHVFHFQFSDDECSFTAIANIVVEVYVSDIANITEDTLRICEGDSLQLKGNTFSGNFLWSPNTAIASTNAPAPFIYPVTSGYYYLQDPVIPNYKDSVFVEVTPTGFFNLALQAGQMVLTDSVQTTTRVWHYNGMPFNYTLDTLMPFGLGAYWVAAKSGSCEFISDTVTIDSLALFSFTSPGNGGFTGTSIPFPGSLGVTFKVSQDVYVKSINIPGVEDLYGKTGGYDLKLQVFDSQHSQIIAVDTTLQKPVPHLIQLAFTNLNIKSNQEYTISVSGDTGYAFSVFENFTLPSTPHNNGLSIVAAREGSHAIFPNNMSQYLLPISLVFERGIGIQELHRTDWDVYPNPAFDQIQIVGLHGAESIQIMDVNGKLVRTVEWAEGKTEVVLDRGDMPSGLYFVKVYFENTTAVKKVLFQ